MTPVFGEFLRPASAHIAAAARFGGDLPDHARRGVITELDHLVTTLARYASDLPLPPSFTRVSNLNPQVEAALDARTALHRAASSLHPAATALQHTTAEDAHPAVGHLSAANRYLTAGRDLLHTHFTPGPDGTLTGNSPWAAVITSAPVTTALASELAACSRHLAAWAGYLSATGSLYAGVPARTSQGLQAAGQWLHLAGTSIPIQPPAAAGSRLLAAIPLNVPPPRQPPGEEETLPELCQGIIITAERLCYAARAFAARARWSPAASSLSWRRDALASAITSHASALILHTLAGHATQLRTSPATGAQLASAADAISQAWPAWREVARHWDIISTGTRQGPESSPVAAELGDLVLRTGRLAYRNPRWTPASAHASPAPNPADLALAASDLKAMLAAVHHATGAISHIATQDTQAVRAAADDRRLYLPTRLLPETYDIPSRYSPVPPQQASELLAAYHTATAASHRAVTALDSLAVTAGAPSSMLAATRISASTAVLTRQPAAKNSTQQPAQPAQPQLALPPDAGQIEHILRSLQITEPAQLLRAAAIDQATRDLLAQAAVTSGQRDSLNRPPPRRIRQTPRQAARLAAQDHPPAPDPGQPAHLSRQAPASQAPPGRTPPKAPTEPPTLALRY